MKRHHVPGVGAVVWIMALTLCLSAASARGAWWDAAWNFRRAVEVNWDTGAASGNELAEVEIYTAGQQRPDAADVRVATAEGRLVASAVLENGPGDRRRLAFALQKGVKSYYVYFGNPEPSKPLAEPPWQCGLMLEMRQFTGGATDNFRQIEEAWQRAKPVLGRTLLDRPFLGVNPFGEQEQTISHVVGSLYAPLDGEYFFAASGDDRAAFYLDGKGRVFAPWGSGDARFNTKLRLTRGPHAFELYHVNTGGEGRFSIVWKRPDMAKLDVIGREAFGVARHGTAGPLEERGKSLTADARIEYLGECFVANNYSHRLKFTAISPRADLPRTHWDFGDGQSAQGNPVEHVYLTRGVYPLRITVRVGGNENVQSVKVPVNRDFPHLDKPQTDEPPVQAKLVAGYDLAALPTEQLTWATWLLFRAGQTNSAYAAAEKMAAAPRRGEVGAAVRLLREMQEAAVKDKRVDRIIQVLQKTPQKSDLNPAAAYDLGSLLLWYQGDAHEAVRQLQPLAAGDENIRRLYAQALLLDQQVKESKKLLDNLPVKGQVERQAVFSGAMARSVEYYLTEGDYQSGDEVWDRWQTQYPTDFLDGYSALLKVRLMEKKGAAAGAAQVAEAFASALPESSYSPRLLDEAVRLLEKSDPKKSAQLRQRLKERYPEDPLSQQTTQPAAK